MLATQELNLSNFISKAQSQLIHETAIMIHLRVVAISLQALYTVLCHTPEKLRSVKPYQIKLHTFTHFAKVCF